MSESLRWYGIFLFGVATLIRYITISRYEASGKLGQVFRTFTFKLHPNDGETLIVIGQVVGIMWLALSLVYPMLKMSPGLIRDMVDLAMYFGPPILCGLIVNIIKGREKK
jgi:hypothetical protein